MSDIEQPSLTRKQFCDLEQIGLTTFHKLKKAGKGPAEMHSPEMSCVRITHEARRAWQLMMEKEAQSEASKLEEARRSERAKVAGLLAAKSALHVSKRGKHKGATRRSAKG